MTRTSVELFDRGYDQGGVAALELFRVELLNSRESIENDSEPTFDAILDVLNRCIAEVKKGV